MNVTAVILAGGGSRRMGESKALLHYSGERFIDRIYARLCDFDEVLVSVDDVRTHPELAGFRLVGDRYPGCGPLAGLHAALASAAEEAVFAVSCDLPLFETELAHRLIARLSAGADAVVPRTADGRVHPLCAAYSKRCAPEFEARLKAGNYRMTDALGAIKTEYFDAAKFAASLSNINTPEQYKQLAEREEKK